MELLHTFKDPDTTLKYVFQDDQGILEILKINTKADRDIFCVPSAYGCGLGCTFCFLTAFDVPNKGNKPVSYQTITECLERIPDRKPNRQISIMGVGEPLLNRQLILDCAASEERTSIASIFPFKPAPLPANVKVHYSLHGTNDEKRRETMPSAKLSIAKAIQYLMEHEGGTEIHYTLIENVNDSDENLRELTRIAQSSGITYKFLDFKESNDLKKSPRLDEFMRKLGRYTTVEFYNPPGEKIQGSCGLFTSSLYRGEPLEAAMVEHLVS